MSVSLKGPAEPPPSANPLAIPEIREMPIKFLPLSSIGSVYATSKSFRVTVDTLARLALQTIKAEFGAKKFKVVSVTDGEESTPSVEAEANLFWRFWHDHKGRLLELHVSIHLKGKGDDHSGNEKLLLEARRAARTRGICCFD